MKALLGGGDRDHLSLCLIINGHGVSTTSSPSKHLCGRGHNFVLRREDEKENIPPSLSLLVPRSPVSSCTHFFQAMRVLLSGLRFMFMRWCCQSLKAYKVISTVKYQEEYSSSSSVLSFFAPSLSLSVIFLRICQRCRA